MCNSRKWKRILFIFFLSVLGITASLFYSRDRRTCLGIPVLTEKEQAAFTEYINIDVGQIILYNKKPVAIDTASSTIYITQKIQEHTEYIDLSGQLQISHPTYTLSFAPDMATTDLFSAVADGYTFKLNVEINSVTCMQYNVVLTTLPVLKLDSYLSGLNDEGRESHTGNICLWSAEDESTGRHSVKDSNANWHIRGDGTASRDKKPWKVSLTTESGEKRNLNFLDLGNDDDWILNPMSLDDTRQKEQLFVLLWNEWADQTSWNSKMSTGQYVEVICDQSYSGIYLLRRRIDRKYYDLPESDILLKGGRSVFTDNLEEAYEIVYSPLDTQTTLSLMAGILSTDDCSMIDLDNFLDTALMVQFASAEDNIGVKNMFYLLKKEEDSYRLSMIPWDTDLSWGVCWTNKYDYSYVESMYSMPMRREYDAMKRLFPDLDWLLEQRWTDMRETVLSTDHVMEILKREQNLLVNSGAFHRDKDRWGETFGGRDTAEDLFHFVRERLLVIDTYYYQERQQ